MVLLVKIPNCTVTLGDNDRPMAHGTLEVTSSDGIGQSSEPQLILTIRTWNYRLLKSSTITNDPSLNRFKLPPPAHRPSSPSITLSIPFSASSDEQNDQESLYSILQNYCSIVTESDKSLRNKILMIDDDTGQVIGEVDAADMGIESGIEEIGLNDAKESKPVLVDINAGGSVRVTVIPEEEQKDDWMLRGASVLSRNMLTASSKLSSGITKARDLYIERTVPRAEPVQISGGTQASLRKINNVTTVGRKGVKATTGAISNVIGKGIGFAVDKGKIVAQEIQQNIQEGPPQYDSNGVRIPPPIPARPGDLNGQPPKRKLLSRVLLAGDVLLSSLEASTVNVLETSSQAATASITHKYGADAGHASKLVGSAGRNVTLSFVDIRGIGHKAIIVGAGKGFVKNEMKKEGLRTVEVETVESTEGKEGIEVVGYNVEDPIALPSPSVTTKSSPSPSPPPPTLLPRPTASSSSTNRALEAKQSATSFTPRPASPALGGSLRPVSPNPSFNEKLAMFSQQGGTSSLSHRTSSPGLKRGWENDARWARPPSSANPSSSSTENSLIDFGNDDQDEEFKPRVLTLNN